MCPRGSLGSSPDHRPLLFLLLSLALTPEASLGNVLSSTGLAIQLLFLPGPLLGPQLAHRGPSGVTKAFGWHLGAKDWETVREAGSQLLPGLLVPLPPPSLPHSKGSNQGCCSPSSRPPSPGGREYLPCPFPTGMVRYKMPFKASVQSCSQAGKSAGFHATKPWCLDLSRRLPDFWWDLGLPRDPVIPKDHSEESREQGRARSKA